jgi:predicted NAD/FAD-dependent oxidoreductase
MRDDQGALIPQDERYRTEVASHLLKDFSEAMEHIANEYSAKPIDIKIKHQQVQRWGRAFPEKKLQLPCLASHDYSMAICGDCFTGLSHLDMPNLDVLRDGNVTPIESAWLSGIAAARSIL